MVHKTIIFGAHGKIGQKLVKLIAGSNKYQATAVVRNDQQSQTIKDISSSVSTAQVSLVDTSVNALADVISGHDSVVLSVGSAGKDLLKVDLDGVVKAFEATVAAETKRLILVSAVHAEDREFGAASPLRDYYIAKHYADRILELEFSDRLDFTILRPSLLTDGEGTGKISMLRPGDTDVGSIDRQDVAATIFEILDNELTYKKAYNFKSGSYDIAEKKTWKTAYDH